MKVGSWWLHADWIFRFLSISSKASTREEFISSLHQAVVEVVTLKTSLQSISTDLSQISYTAEALASIAATAIELNVTGKQIALKYPESGRETILAAFSGNSDHVQDLSVSEQKDFGAEDRSPGTSDDLASGFEGHIQEVQAQQDHFNAGAADEQQNHAVTEDSEEFDEVNERSSAIDSVEQLDPKTRTSYTVTSLKFLTLPLGSLELRFWVSRGSLTPMALLTQYSPDHEKIVSIDRASHTRSPLHLFRDPDACLQLSHSKQQPKAEEVG